MSTEPNAPPSDDDAPRQDAPAPNDTVPSWAAFLERHQRPAAEQYTPALLSAWAWPRPLPDLDPPNVFPFHRAVGFADIWTAQRLLVHIAVALGTGDRKLLDEMEAMRLALSDAKGGVPHGKDEAKLFFLARFRNILTMYVKDGEFRPDLVHWGLLNMNTMFVDCDPAFAKLDNVYVAECIKSIKNGRGAYANDWKRVAAQIAVRVGAFDSAKLGTTDKEREDALMADFGPKWTQRDQTRFPERPLPEPKKEKLPAKKRSRPV